MNAPHSPAGPRDTAREQFEQLRYKVALPTPNGSSEAELLAAERRFQLARNVGKAFDLSLNCMQIARWLHPFDEIARYAFFRELRRDKMKAAGLPLEILGRAA